MAVLIMEMWDGYEVRPSSYEEDIDALIPERRSPEEMRALHERRLAELEEEAKRKSRTRPCKTCRYGIAARCIHPLIKGFDTSAPFNMSFEIGHHGLVGELCGPERALWTPQLTLKLRIKEFFLTRWLRWKGEL